MTGSSNDGATAAPPGNGRYDAGSIVVLSAIDAIRMRPGMYVGSTGPAGVMQLVVEVLQNALDEALAGHAQHIEVSVSPDGRWTVSDDGRGIPVDLVADPEGGPGRRRVPEIVLTQLHSGGKFKEGAYELPGGLHGVGLTCVNALSSDLVMEVRRDAGRWRGRWARGATVEPFERVGDLPADGAGGAGATGTTVSFQPDPAVFGGAAADPGAVETWLRAQAWLTRGLQCTLARNGAVSRFSSEEGVSGFARWLAEREEKVHPNPVHVRDQSGPVVVDAALLWTRAYREEVVSFVNHVHTALGGAHADGLRAAVTQELCRYAEAHTGNDPGAAIGSADAVEGLVAVVSVRMKEPQFEGQTKTRLRDAAAGEAVKRAVGSALREWFAAHPGEAAAVVGRAIEASRARTASRRASERARYERVDQPVDKEIYKKQFGIRSKNWHQSADWIANQGLLSMHGGSSQMAADAVVLDVCCGSGVVGNSFRGKVGRIIGLDLTPEMVALSRTRLDEVVQGDVYDIPFPDASFDGVCNREVLHLLPQPERPLAQIFRVLKPGGQFVVGQWVPYSAIDGPWMFQVTKKKQPLFVNNLYDEDMRRLITEAGFENISTREFLQWEDIDNWIATWETPPLHRHQIRDLYHHCPEEVRAVHPFEISATGAIRDCWRWVIYSAFKPGKARP